MKKLLLVALFALCFSNIANSQCVSTLTTLPATCGFVCDGSVFIQFATTAVPVTVTINGGPPITTGSAFQQGGLCPGAYTFLAIDDNGDTCSGTNVFIIPQLASHVVTLSTTYATCQTCNDGSMIATVTGGNPPFSYLWSNGSTAPILVNASPGIYCVTVTDAFNCSVTACDSVGNGNNGYYSLQGNIYLDANSNGVKDVGEVGIQNQSVNIQPTGTTALSNANGQYLDIVLPGTYDVAFNATPGWMVTSSPSSYNLTVTNANIGSLDFGIYPDSTAGSAVISLSSFFPRCFLNVGYMIHVNNNGFTTLTGTVELTYDPALTYVNSTPVPISHVGNVLTFSFTNLPPGSVGNFNLTFTEPAGGTALSSTVALDASDSFGNQISQNSTLIQTVSCAYDPNDKQVNPLGSGQFNYVPMDEWLTYQIRFQNTGTDTAFKVVIVDTLDLNLDINSFTVLGSSHNVSTTIRPSREVNFTYENILLPDSNVNEPASHGYVLYRIKGSATNPDPAMVENTAHIIFDLNSAIVTNTTLTTFSDNFLSIDEPGVNTNFEVFPNPMTHSATVRMKNNINSEYSIFVYDLTGRNVITSGKLKNGSFTLYKSDLNAGVYILEARSASEGTAQRVRLVVQ